MTMALAVGDLTSSLLADGVDEYIIFFFFQAEDGIRDSSVTGVQTCALPISLLLMSGERAKALGLTPLARLHSFAVAADDPVMMLTAIIPATSKVLGKAALSVADIDLFEVNEAFASVVLAWQRETGADLDRVNVHGVAIAIRHPLGASRTRLMPTLVHAMHARGARLALQTICEAPRLANPTIPERLY